MHQIAKVNFGVRKIWNFFPKNIFFFPKIFFAKFFSPKIFFRKNFFRKNFFPKNFFLQILNLASPFHVLADLSHKFLYFSKSKMATSHHFEFRCNYNRIPTRCQSIPTKYLVISMHSQDVHSSPPPQISYFSIARWRPFRHFKLF